MNESLMALLHASTFFLLFRFLNIIIDMFVIIAFHVADFWTFWPKNGGWSSSWLKLTRQPFIPATWDKRFEKESPSIVPIIEPFKVKLKEHTPVLLSLYITSNWKEKEKGKRRSNLCISINVLLICILFILKFLVFQMYDLAVHKLLLYSPIYL